MRCNWWRRRGEDEGTVNYLTFHIYYDAMEFPPFDLPDPDDIAEEAILCRCRRCDNILAYREKGRGYPVLMLTDMSEVNTARLDDETDSFGLTLTCPYCSAAYTYEIDDIPEADEEF